MAEQKILDPKEAKKQYKEALKAAKAAKAEAGEDEGIVSKIVVGLVAILIIAIWLFIIGLLIKMDVGGFGSTVLQPILKDVPVINKVLPDSVVEEAEVDEAYAFKNMDEAVARVQELESQLADANTTNENTAARIAELESYEAELATFKANQAQFEQDKNNFYEEVVFSDNAPDINEYKTYYESIDPQKAEELYKQVVRNTVADEEVENYVKAYSSMKPAAAAKIFDNMTDDFDLVAKILLNMDASTRADILAAMDQQNAAALTKLMEP